MKIARILVSFALIVIVQGNILAAAVRGIEPIILSFGAAFAAKGILDSQYDDDVNHYNWNSLINLFKGNTEKTTYLSE